MIDKKPENNPIYFTIIPSKGKEGKAGFTDQLFQFSSFYKLGLSLGFIYLHSTFVNDRKGSEGIFDFLGFNEHFCQNRLTTKEKVYRFMGVNNCFGRENIGLRNRIRRKIRFWMCYPLFFREFNFIDIGIGDKLPDITVDGHLNGIKDSIRKVVLQKGKRGSTQKTVVRFHLSERGRYFFGKLAPAINQQIPYYQDRLDLRSRYFKCRESQPVRSWFSDGKIKLQVHIRLGDTAMIETPWHSFVPLWSGWPLVPLKEYPDRNKDVFGGVMDVSDYMSFLDHFNSFFDPNDLSIAVFSDGYKRAFKELFHRIEDLKLDDKKVHALKEAESAYEENRFSVFDNMENCVRRVGENNTDLQELIHSSLMADVIIVGCHQRMIPKFLATYYDISLQHPPIIIALYKSRLPHYEEALGLDEKKATVYPINITDLECDDTLIAATEEVKRRQSFIEQEPKHLAR